MEIIGWGFLVAICLFGFFTVISVLAAPILQSLEDWIYWITRKKDVRDIYNTRRYWFRR